VISKPLVHGLRASRGTRRQPGGRFRNQFQALRRDGGNKQAPGPWIPGASRRRWDGRAQLPKGRPGTSRTEPPLIDHPPRPGPPRARGTPGVLRAAREAGPEGSLPRSLRAGPACPLAPRTPWSSLRTKRVLSNRLARKRCARPPARGYHGQEQELARGGAGRPRRPPAARPCATRPGRSGKNLWRGPVSGKPGTCCNGNASKAAHISLIRRTR